jgi:putative ABC transport system permease protein
MIEDLRFGVRVLIKNPGFALIAVLTLAIGIGANTAIFSVVDALLFRPLPYSNPDRLVWVGEVSPQTKTEVVVGPHFLEWSEQANTVATIAAYSPQDVTLSGRGEPERLNGNRVSADFFPTLGVQPSLGRNFVSDEDRPSAGQVVIITDGLWKRRFGGDPTIVGTTITLDEKAYSVVGVLPPDFRYVQPYDFWTPLALDPQQERGNQQISILSVIARLKPGVTVEQAQAELETISSRFDAGRPGIGPLMAASVRVMSLHAKLVGDTRRLLAILLGAVSLILFIACANVANLLLSRAAVRQKEVAIRSALGAGPMRLVRQMLTESILLAFAGGGLGLLVAFWLVRSLVALASSEAFGEISRLASVSIDIRVLCFTLLISLATGTLFGLVPAIQLSRPNLNEVLKEGGQGSGSQRGRLRGVLMVSEVALAIVLLIGAGLLIRSFANLLRVNPGYRVDNLLTLRISLPDLSYEQKSRRAEFHRELLRRVSSLPGVEAAGEINHLPLTEYQFGGWLRVPDRPTVSNRDQPATPIGIVSPNYFRAIGISLRAGREFTEGDNSESPRVVILSEALARGLFPDEDPIGKQVWVPGPGKSTPTVVGIVADIRHTGLDKDVTPQVYVPYLQYLMQASTLVIRTAGDSAALAAAVREQVASIDNSLPVYEVKTMEERLASAVAPRRFNLMLLGLFALFAMVLAAIGIYGVISHAAAQRTHEIGIRMALGARGGDVLKLLVGRGMMLVGVGVVLGLAGAWGLTRLMSSLLFGVSATDPVTFGCVACFLSAVALAACYFPARRAARIDPMAALRHE